MAYEFDYQQTYEKFCADVVQLHLNQRIPEAIAFRENAEVRLVLPHTMKAMVAQLTTWCAAGRVPDLVTTETVEYPDGTWQTFKHLHLPSWFTKQFPARMKRITVERSRNIYFMCPHVSTERQNRGHIEFMMTGHRRESYPNSAP